MINGKSILAIIPARQGSKRLTNKNIRILGDKPLIAWTIEAAKASKYIDKVIVSTDSDKIAKIAKEWKAEVPFRRPHHLAKDEISSEDVIRHALNYLIENKSLFYDNFVLLQPTSPVRSKYHINEAIEVFNKYYNVCDKVVSVYKLIRNDIHSIDDKSMIHYNRSINDINFIRKENEYFIINGAIYICKSNVFLSDNNLIYGNCIPYIMEESCSIDIDTLEDFITAKKKLNYK